MSIDAAVQRTLATVAPGLTYDQAVFRHLLDQPIDPGAAITLLSSPSVEVVRSAVLYLGIYGTLRECPVLALHLQHDDVGVAQLAEHALWSIWMHGGSPEANRQLARAVERIQNDDVDDAIRTLTLLTATDPNFAEAHFQLGLALSSADRAEEAVRAYRTALKFNPYHFAAAAGLGHAYVELGHLEAAIHHYELALRLHPRLPDVPFALREVRSILARRRCNSA